VGVDDVRTLKFAAAGCAEREATCFNEAFEIDIKNVDNDNQPNELQSNCAANDEKVRRSQAGTPLTYKIKAVGTATLVQWKAYMDANTPGYDGLTDATLLGFVFTTKQAPLPGTDKGGIVVKQNRGVKCCGGCEPVEEHWRHAVFNETARCGSPEFFSATPQVLAAAAGLSNAATDEERIAAAQATDPERQVCTCQRQLYVEEKRSVVCVAMKAADSAFCEALTETACRGDQNCQLSTRLQACGAASTTVTGTETVASECSCAMNDLGKQVQFLAQPNACRQTCAMCSDCTVAPTLPLTGSFLGIHGGVGDFLKNAKDAPQGVWGGLRRNGGLGTTADLNGAALLEKSAADNRVTIHAVELVNAKLALTVVASYGPDTGAYGYRYPFQRQYNSGYPNVCETVDTDTVCSPLQEPCYRQDYFEVAGKLADQRRCPQACYRATAAECTFGGFPDSKLLNAAFQTLTFTPYGSETLCTGDAFEEPVYRCEHTDDKFEALCRKVETDARLDEKNDAAGVPLLNFNDHILGFKSKCEAAATSCVCKDAACTLDDKTTCGAAANKAACAADAKCYYAPCQFVRKVRTAEHFLDDRVLGSTDCSRCLPTPTSEAIKADAQKTLGEQCLPRQGPPATCVSTIDAGCVMVEDETCVPSASEKCRPKCYKKGTETSTKVQTGCSFKEAQPDEASSTTCKYCIVDGSGAKVWSDGTAYAPVVKDTSINVDAVSGEIKGPTLQISVGGSDIIDVSAGSTLAVGVGLSTGVSAEIHVSGTCKNPAVPSTAHVASPCSAADYIPHAPDAAADGRACERGCAIDAPAVETGVTAGFSAATLTVTVGTGGTVTKVEVDPANKGAKYEAGRVHVVFTGLNDCTPATTMQQTCRAVDSQKYSAADWEVLDTATKTPQKNKKFCDYVEEGAPPVYDAGQTGPPGNMYSAQHQFMAHYPGMGAGGGAGASGTCLTTRGTAAEERAAPTACEVTAAAKASKAATCTVSFLTSGTKDQENAAPTTCELVCEAKATAGTSPSVQDTETCGEYNTAKKLIANCGDDVKCQYKAGQCKQSAGSKGSCVYAAAEAAVTGACAKTDAAAKGTCAYDAANTDTFGSWWTATPPERDTRSAAAAGAYDATGQCPSSAGAATCTETYRNLQFTATETAASDAVELSTYRILELSKDGAASNFVDIGAAAATVGTTFERDATAHTGTGRVQLLPSTGWWVKGLVSGATAQLQAVGGVSPSVGVAVLTTDGDPFVAGEFLRQCTDAGCGTLCLGGPNPVNVLDCPAVNWEATVTSPNAFADKDACAAVQGAQLLDNTECVKKKNAVDSRDATLEACTYTGGLAPTDGLPTDAPALAKLFKGYPMPTAFFQLLGADGLPTADATTLAEDPAFAPLYGLQPYCTGAPGAPADKTACELVNGAFEYEYTKLQEECEAKDIDGVGTNSKRCIVVRGTDAPPTAPATYERTCPFGKVIAKGANANALPGIGGPFTDFECTSSAFRDAEYELSHGYLWFEESANADRSFWRTKATTTDRVCSRKTICQPHEYESYPGDAYHDRRCSPLTVCDRNQYSESELRVHPYILLLTGQTMYVGLDRVCKPLTLCSCKQFETVEPAFCMAYKAGGVQYPVYTQDRTCTAITECTEYSAVKNTMQQFESTYPTKVQNLELCAGPGSDGEELDPPHLDCSVRHPQWTQAAYPMYFTDRECRDFDKNWDTLDFPGAACGAESFDDSSGAGTTVTCELDHVVFSTGTGAATRTIEPEPETAPLATSFDFVDPNGKDLLDATDNYYKVENVRVAVSYPRDDANHGCVDSPMDFTAALTGETCSVLALDKCYKDNELVPVHSEYIEAAMDSWRPTVSARSACCACGGGQAVAVNATGPTSFAVSQMTAGGVGAYPEPYEQCVATPAPDERDELDFPTECELTRATPLAAGTCARSDSLTNAEARASLVDSRGEAKRRTDDTDAELGTCACWRQLQALVLIEDTAAKNDVDADGIPDVDEYRKYLSDAASANAATTYTSQKLLVTAFARPDKPLEDSNYPRSYVAHSDWQPQNCCNGQAYPVDTSTDCRGIPATASFACSNTLLCTNGEMPTGETCANGALPKCSFADGGQRSDGTKNPCLQQAPVDENGVPAATMLDGSLPGTSDFAFRAIDGGGSDPNPGYHQTVGVYAPPSADWCQAQRVDTCSFQVYVLDTEAPSLTAPVKLDVCTDGGSASTSMYATVYTSVLRRDERGTCVPRALPVSEASVVADTDMTDTLQKRCSLPQGSWVDRSVCDGLLVNPQCTGGTGATYRQTRYCETRTKDQCTAAVTTKNNWCAGAFEPKVDYGGLPSAPALDADNDDCVGDNKYGGGLTSSNGQCGTNGPQATAQCVWLTGSACEYVDATTVRPSGSDNTIGSYAYEPMSTSYNGGKNFFPSVVDNVDGVDSYFKTDIDSCATSAALKTRAIFLTATLTATLTANALCVGGDTDAEKAVCLDSTLTHGADCQGVLPTKCKKHDKTMAGVCLPIDSTIGSTTLDEDAAAAYYRVSVDGTDKGVCHPKLVADTETCSAETEKAGCDGKPACSWRRSDDAQCAARAGQAQCSTATSALGTPSCVWYPQDLNCGGQVAVSERPEVLKGAKASGTYLFRPRTRTYPDVQGHEASCTTLSRPPAHGLLDGPGGIAPQLEGVCMPGVPAIPGECSAQLTKDDCFTKGSAAGAPCVWAATPAKGTTCKQSLIHDTMVFVDGVDVVGGVDGGDVKDFVTAHFPATKCFVKPGLSEKDQENCEAADDMAACGEVNTASVTDKPANKACDWVNCGAAAVNNPVTEACDWRPRCTGWCHSAERGAYTTALNAVSLEKPAYLVGEHTIRWKATDSYGNAASVAAVLTVHDCACPTFGKLTATDLTETAGVYSADTATTRCFKTFDDLSVAATDNSGILPKVQLYVEEGGVKRFIDRDYKFPIGDTVVKAMAWDMSAQLADAAGAGLPYPDSTYSTMTAVAAAAVPVDGNVHAAALDAAATSAGTPKYVGSLDFYPRIDGEERTESAQVPGVQDSPCVKSFTVRVVDNTAPTTSTCPAKGQPVIAMATRTDGSAKFAVATPGATNRFALQFGSTALDAGVADNSGCTNQAATKFYRQPSCQASAGATAEDVDYCKTITDAATCNAAVPAAGPACGSSTATCAWAGEQVLPLDSSVANSNTVLTQSQFDALNAAQPGTVSLATRFFIGERVPVAVDYFDCAGNKATCEFFVNVPGQWMRHSGFEYTPVGCGCDCDSQAGSAAGGQHAYAMDMGLTCLGTNDLAVGGGKVDLSGKSPIGAHVSSSVDPNCDPKSTTGVTCKNAAEEGASVYPAQTGYSTGWVPTWDNGVFNAATAAYTPTRTDNIGDYTGATQDLDCDAVGVAAYKVIDDRATARTYKKKTLKAVADWEDPKKYVDDDFDLAIVSTSLLSSDTFGKSYFHLEDPDGAYEVSLEPMQLPHNTETAKYFAVTYRAPATTTQGNLLFKADYVTAGGRTVEACQSVVFEFDPTEPQGSVLEQGTCSPSASAVARNPLVFELDTLKCTIPDGSQLTTPEACEATKQCRAVDVNVAADWDACTANPADATCAGLFRCRPTTVEPTGGCVRYDKNGLALTSFRTTESKCGNTAVEQNGGKADVFTPDATTDGTCTTDGVTAQNILKKDCAGDDVFKSLWKTHSGADFCAKPDYNYKNDQTPAQNDVRKSACSTSTFADQRPGDSLCAPTTSPVCGLLKSDTATAQPLCTFDAASEVPLANQPWTQYACKLRPAAFGVTTATFGLSSTDATAAADFDLAGIGEIGCTDPLSAQYKKDPLSSEQVLDDVAETTSPGVPLVVGWTYTATGDVTTSGRVNAGEFSIGLKYKIVNVADTDYTLIGADDSVVDTIFTATGVGVGGGAAEAVQTYTEGESFQVVEGPVIYTGSATSGKTYNENAIMDDGTCVRKDCCGDQLATTYGAECNVVLNNPLACVYEDKDMLLAEMQVNLDSLKKNEGTLAGLLQDIQTLMER
jgi:hypothetical protein